jgi:hypothetical protein
MEGTPMKKLAPALLATAALAMLGACATSYGGHHDGYYVDAYYDDGYGPYNDGYWGDDGAFYYRDAADHPFIRDDAHHFRRDNFTGFHHVQAHAKAPSGEHHGEPK